MLIATSSHPRRSGPVGHQFILVIVLALLSAVLSLFNVVQNGEAFAETQEADRNSMQDQTRQDTRQPNPSRAGGRVESNLSRREPGTPRNAASPSASVMDTSRYDATQRSSDQTSDAYPAAR